MREIIVQQVVMLQVVVEEAVILQIVVGEVVVLQLVVREIVVQQNVVGSAVVARAFLLQTVVARIVVTTKRHKISRLSCGTKLGTFHISPARSGEQGPCLEEGSVLGPISGGRFWSLFMSELSGCQRCSVSICGSTSKGVASAKV
jgi:hypothetical protein